MLRKSVGEGERVGGEGRGKEGDEKVKGGEEEGGRRKERKREKVCVYVSHLWLCHFPSPAETRGLIHISMGFWRLLLLG